MDYDCLAGMLNDVDYRGYGSIEHEGKAMAGEGITSSVKELIRNFQLDTSVAN